ncbi:MAG: hypothetical protein ACYDBB_27235 [Armatimonadota bacterium]
MTTHDFILFIGHYPLILLACCAGVPLLAFVCGACHGKGNGGQAPWKYCYTVLIYLACITGLFSSVITAYTLFFTHESLLNVNALVYFGPIVSMVVTLALMNQQVSFTAIPGIDRLSAFVVLIVASFAIALAVDKTFIGILFFGTLRSLLLLALVVFVVLKVAAYLLFRRSDAAEEAMPKDDVSSVM